jgi:hypothetical protein
MSLAVSYALKGHVGVITVDNAGTVQFLLSLRAFKEPKYVIKI